MALDKLTTWLQLIIWSCLAVIIFSPLFLSSQLFFPFIVTKTVAFTMAVEIMLVAFLLLAWKDSAYKLKINLVIVLFAVYIAIIFIASFFGDDFSRSFWGNNERSEGILLLLHLFAFVVVVTGFLKQLKHWLVVFDAFLLSSFLVTLIGLAQHFDVAIFGYGVLEVSSQRLTSTIGNAGYMAGFLVFTIFFGLLLLFQRKHIGLKAYYGVIVVVAFFVTLYTDTRGAILALFITGTIFVLYLLFFYFKDKRFKIIGVALVLTAIILPVALFTFKDTALVQNNRVLSRVSSISPESATAKTRLMTWQSSWQGFQDRPIIGYGYENFYQAFDRYFNPKIYRHSGSVIWFDRAHNIIFDRLITGGIVGLLSYLSLLMVPFYFLWKNYIKRDKSKNKYFLPVTLTLTMLAYLIQNFFIFESLVIYIPLFLTLGLVGLYGVNYQWPVLHNKKFLQILAVVAVILLLPALYFFNIKPLQNNMALARAVSTPDLTLDERLDIFDSIFSTQDKGSLEYRRQLFSLYEQMAIAGKFAEPEMPRLAKMVEDEYLKQVAEAPFNVSNFIILMRYYNLNATIDPEVRITKSLPLFERAVFLSPTRAQIYFEMGYAYLYLADTQERTGDDENANLNYAKAVEMFETAVDLNDENIESHRQLINTLVYAGDNDRVVEIVSGLNDRMMSFDRTSLYTQIVNSGIRARNYRIVQFSAQELININPDNPKNYQDLAMAYAYLGEDAQALQLAEEIRDFGEQYSAWSDEFISKIRAQVYR